ncbi:hypothetical protein NL676_037489 [Syzygium grande]|nr:hypothetical protein NL676_037489 [Syzygium grande]
MSDARSGAVDAPAVSESKGRGGSEAARIPEVEAWLASQFEAAGKEVHRPRTPTPPLPLDLNTKTTICCHQHRHHSQVNKDTATITTAQR